MPSARVVALVRDPIRRAHAAWDQNRRSNQEDRGFEAAARAELPVARRCAALAGGVANLFARVAANGTAGAAHGLVEYVERCAIFVDGRPRNCWVDKTYLSPESLKPPYLAQSAVVRADSLIGAPLDTRSQRMEQKSLSKSPIVGCVLTST